MLWPLPGLEPAGPQHTPTALHTSAPGLPHLEESPRPQPTLCTQRPLAQLEGTSLCVPKAFCVAWPGEACKGVVCGHQGWCAHRGVRSPQAGCAPRIPGAPLKSLPVPPPARSKEGSGCVCPSRGSCAHSVSGMPRKGSALWGAVQALRGGHSALGLLALLGLSEGTLLTHARQPQQEGRLGGSQVRGGSSPSTPSLFDVSLKTTTFLLLVHNMRAKLGYELTQESISASRDGRSGRKPALHRRTGWERAEGAKSPLGLLRAHPLSLWLGSFRVRDRKGKPH